MNNKLIHKNKGFTVLELLVVIAIMGVITSIVLLTLNETRDKARVAHNAEILYQYTNAMALCMDNLGDYPKQDTLGNSLIIDDVGLSAIVCVDDAGTGSCITSGVTITNSNDIDCGNGTTLKTYYPSAVSKENTNTGNIFGKIAHATTSIMEDVAWENSTNVGLIYYYTTNASINAGVFGARGYVVANTRERLLGMLHLY